MSFYIIIAIAAFLGYKYFQKENENKLLQSNNAFKEEIKSYKFSIENCEDLIATLDAEKDIESNACNKLISTVSQKSYCASLGIILCIQPYFKLLGVYFTMGSYCHKLDYL